MARETEPMMPMMTGGCRQQTPAADETGVFFPRDMEGAAGGERWIYGDPQTGWSGQPAAPNMPAYMPAGTEMPHTMPSGGMDGTSVPGADSGTMPVGMSSSAAQQERMRNPVSMAGTHAPADAQQAYQASLRSLLDRNVGYFVAATFLVGTGQTVTWQGILHTVGSDYLVLYQPDYGRYISCDLYSLKFVQFHNTKGVPYCAASQSWQGQTGY